MLSKILFNENAVCSVVPDADDDGEDAGSGLRLLAGLRRARGRYPISQVDMIDPCVESHIPGSQ